MKSRSQKVLKLAQSQILRPHEMARFGVSGKQLSSLVAAGDLRVCDFVGVVPDRAKKYHILLDIHTVALTIKL